MMNHSDELIGLVRQLCPFFVTVDHPWFMEALDELDQEIPAALIWMSGDEALDEPKSQVATQQVVQNYGVWIVAPRDRLEQARSEIRGLMLGWSPNEMTGDAYYLKGRAENIAGDIVWWREYWALPVWIRQR